MEITKKELTYKGKKIEELQALDVREFAKLLPSKQKRFVLRNFQEIENFVARAKDKQAKGKKIKTHIRDIVVVPHLVGMNIQIYNGRRFEPVELTIESLGHKLGEFSLTRMRTAHTKAGVGATKGSQHKSKK
jgi:small subunit ribosomal protein S19